jgi:hypothetical protein
MFSFMCDKFEDTKGVIRMEEERATQWSTEKGQKANNYL